MKKSIPIVTAADDNYALGIAGLIVSIGRTNQNCEVTVLSLGILSDNKRKLVDLGQLFAVNVSIVEVNYELVASLKITRQHITAATFLRLLIPSIFPDSGNLLYLDCDMIVVGSLDPLFDVDLGSNLIAAVKDPSALDSQPNKPPSDEINAGMLLMNIPAWLAENTADACLDLLANPESSFTFEDQSAINQVCFGRVLFLAQEWNTHAAHNLDQPYLYSTPENARILHFVGDIKPWNSKTIFSDLWWVLFENGSFSLPPRNAISFRRRLSSLNLKRREAMARLVGKSKAKEQMRFGIAVKTKIVPLLAARLRAGGQ